MKPALLAAGLAACLLLAAPGARAQPCIPCSACATDNCWRVCQPSCGGISPSQIVVSGDACARAGTAYGPTAASQACSTAMLYCNGGTRPVGGALGAIGPVTLSQCSNVAMGTCQQTASVQTPCAAQLEFGYAQCSAQQFREFYDGETSGRCRTWAQTVTGVDPGTNNWVIGSAAPGGGIGSAAPGGGRRMLRGARA